VAQGSNFGIGLVAAGTNDNTIEDNTAVENTNGIVLVAGTMGNVIRRNLFAGNPAVQVSVDHAASSGVDIRNLSSVGANTFDGNICLTSVNAPCPDLGPSLTASPNPITVMGAASIGMTTISWNAPGAQIVEIHIGSPDGKLFAFGGNRGSAPTGLWVPEGMIFYLQDVTGGRSLTAANTLATLVVHLKR
jgi:parallel beta-helix repeat protein